MLPARFTTITLVFSSFGDARKMPVPTETVEPAASAQRSAQRQRKFDCWLGAAVTRQIVFDRSSATISAPRLLSTVTPTGRPRVLPSSPMKPVSTSTGGPDGRPLLKGTNTTL